MDKLNKETEEFIKKTTGYDVFSLVKILINRKKVSENKLAEHCKKELNEVRSMLYKLHNLNFAFFIKKKDKNTGLYIYYWSIEIKKMNEFFIKCKKKEIDELKNILEYEANKKFYICSGRCVRFDFEKACEYEFRCPECNNLLDYEKNNKKREGILKRLDDIKTTI